MDPNEVETLMVKIVDNTASPQERDRLMSYLQDHPERGKELDQHLALKAVTDGWVERFEADLIADGFRRHPFTRFELVFGLVFSILGILLMSVGGLAHGVIEMLNDPAVPVWFKAGSIMSLIGFTILCFSVIRWRITSFKRDPYKEIIR